MSTTQQQNTLNSYCKDKDVIEKDSEMKTCVDRNAINVKPTNFASCPTAAKLTLSCIMLHLSPSWSERTIALLLGKSLHRDGKDIPPPGSAHVELMKRNGDSPSARLCFASTTELAQVVNAYEGIAVPMTHGYHYYTFDYYQYHENNSSINDNKPFGMTASPPLHLQLMALSTKDLEHRAKKLFVVDQARVNGKKPCRVQKHADFAFRLCRALGNDRRTRQVAGVPLPPGSTNALLTYLDSCTLWPPLSKQRKGVSAGNYLTVRRQHSPSHDAIWNLCRNLICTVVADPIYNALAITRSFRGSPHVDNHDVTFQHVIALGNFQGGRLCTEENETTVVEIDVRNRVGRIDGRAVHWVSGWSGERYSIVYYSTAKEDWTERAPQQVHTQWMQNVQFDRNNKMN